VSKTPLFYKLEKRAEEKTKLSQDTNSWEETILREIFSIIKRQDLRSEIVFKSMEEETGDALGEVTLFLDDKTKIKIPFIIKKYYLYPLDIFEYNEKLYPLNSHRIKTLLTPSYGKLVKEEDVGSSDFGSSLEEDRDLSKLVGPYSALNKGASLSETNILDYLTPDITEKDLDKFASILEPIFPIVIQNDAVKSTISKLHDFAFNNNIENDKFVADFEPDVVQIRKTNDGYIVKEASAAAYKPIEYELDYLDFDTLDPQIKTRVLRNGYYTFVKNPITENPDLEKEASYDYEEIENACKFTLYDLNNVPSIGYAIKLHGLNKTAWFNNNYYAIEDKLPGRVKGLCKFAELKQQEDKETSRKGLFLVKTASDIKGIYLDEIDHVSKQQGQVVVEGKDYGGRPTEIIVSSIIRKPTLIKNAYYLPTESVAFISFENKQEISPQILVSKHPTYEITITKSGDYYTLDGTPLDEIHHLEKNAVSEADASFILGLFGITEEQTRPLLKQSSISIPVSYKLQSSKIYDDYINELSKENERLFNQLNIEKVPSIIKTAAEIIKEPLTFETIASLGFLNPKTIGKFLQFIPEFEETVSDLASLLLASRIGLNLESENIKYVMEGLDDIIFQLQQISKKMMNEKLEDK
jgi:hypothetical protein